jgi:hypothetical protein
VFAAMLAVFGGAMWLLVDQERAADVIAVKTFVK